ncbi:MAG: tetratricopeptide repeat protein, partial [Waddliaceae bacterium]
VLASKISSPNQHDDLICPISQEPFRDPVMDNHGHNFEKESIEEYFRHIGRRECPLSRQPINSLAPNLAIKAMVDAAKKKSPVPTCDCFEKHNQKLAKRLMEQGQLFEEEQEYEDALDSYAKALKYTEKSDDYASIPRIFEKQGDNERAALSYLHLAKYQVQEGKFTEAANNLQKACDLVPDCIELTDPLARCYLQTNPKEAAPLFFKLGRIFLDKNHRERAIHYYQCAVDADPDHPHSYEALADLYEKSSDQAHVYLRGALHFSHRDKQQAEIFCKRACDLYPEDFNGYFPYLELLTEQKRIPELIDLYKQLITLYEKRGLFQEMLTCYKKLIVIEEKPEYYKKIVTLYLNQRQQEDALAWNLRWMNFHMGKEELIQAEGVGKQALRQNDASIEVLENLQTIYQLGNSDKLKPLLVRLGRAYEQNRQLAQAEKTYRVAWERFQDSEAYFSLAGVLIHQDRRDEGLAVYKEIAEHSYVEEEFSFVDRCYQAIKRIDPHFASFSHQEKMAFVTQHHVLHLNNQLIEERAVAREEIKRLKGRIEDLEKLPVIQEAKNFQRAEELRAGLPKIAFGKVDWEKYFGEVGEEPPLPADIKKILQGPCPFWEGKKVEDTHLLVLLPKTVNGRPLTLNTLEELIQRPRGGWLATKYSCYYDGIKEEFGDQEVGRSSWVLMTRDVLEGSRNKSYDDQRALVEEYAKRAGLPYEMPHALEAVVSILMHHAKTGERLYPGLSSYTRCQEKLVGAGGWPSVVGCFPASASGLMGLIGYACGDYGGVRGVGVGGVRKF